MEIDRISAGDVSASTSAETWGSDYTYFSSGTIEYRCKSDGLYLREVWSEYEGESSGYAYEGWSLTTYYDSFIQPRTLAVGDSWEVAQTMTVETDSTPATEYSYDYAWEVADEVEVSVEAGDFTALKLVEQEYGSRSWLARDVGTVKTDQSELSSYER